MGAVPGLALRLGIAGCDSKTLGALVDWALMVLIGLVWCIPSLF